MNFCHFQMLILLLALSPSRCDVCKQFVDTLCLTAINNSDQNKVCAKSHFQTQRVSVSASECMGGLCVAWHVKWYTRKKSAPKKVAFIFVFFRVLLSKTYCTARGGHNFCFYFGKSSWMWLLVILKLLTGLFMSIVYGKPKLGRPTDRPTKQTIQIWRFYFVLLLFLDKQ